ncbi:replication initiator [Longispora albida]|uniref:replication initiator n=1 Tax=Longispora albida TaxID=203523 RepID=UPI00036D32B8|nr:replication initiator [Longispora albida]
MTATVTALPLPGLAPVQAEPEAPRPGSRAARQTVPLSKAVLKEIAAEAGVCLHPIALRRTDTTTGLTEITEVPCGARLASKCVPCAEKNRKLRVQQIREGWHRDTEPDPVPRQSTMEERWLVTHRAALEWERAALATAQLHPDERARQLADLDAAIEDIAAELANAGLRGSLPSSADKAKPAVKRSTKRRQDVPDLPRMKVDRGRTVGRVIAGRDGSMHRDSMLLTITLPSYGDIHSPRRAGRPVCACGSSHHPDDPVVGTPVDPASYDYRRAALDSIHFSRLTDRLWQNLRRATGINIQYAGCVELQKRLAPHAHFAVRGTVPRALVRRVAEATYHQVWWPAHDELAHDPARPPRYDAEADCWIDHAGTPVDLVPWDDAVEAIDQDDQPEPAHVIRCGRIDPRGVKGGTKDAERTVRYVTKYLTKDITDHVKPEAAAAAAHFDRLHAELSVLPCSATCANWILYGIAPKGCSGKLRPGNCRGSVHQRESLGFTGRRVLISRQWSGKTLTDHRADNAAWVRALLALGNGDQDGEQQPGQPPAPARYAYELCRPGDPDLPPESVRIMRAITVRAQWKHQVRQATQRLEELSATGVLARAA